MHQSVVKWLKLMKTLNDNPEYVNESPFEKAWMIVLEPSDSSEIDKLLTADQYEAMTNED